MTIVYDKLMALQIRAGGPGLRCQGLHALCARRPGWATISMNEDELAFVYEKNPESAADHGDRHRPLRLAGAQSRRQRHQLGHGGRWRGAQGFTLRRPLKGEDAVVGRCSASSKLIDEGAGKGALLLDGTKKSPTRRRAAH